MLLILQAAFVTANSGGGSDAYADTSFDDGEVAPCEVLDDSNIPVIKIGEQINVCDIGGRRICGEPNLSFSVSSQYTHNFCSV